MYQSKQLLGGVFLKDLWVISGKTQKSFYVEQLGVLCSLSCSYKHDRWIVMFVLAIF